MIVESSNYSRLLNEHGPQIKRSIWIFLEFNKCSLPNKKIDNQLDVVVTTR